jgi:hypothetical protein
METAINLILESENPTAKRLCVVFSEFLNPAEQAGQYVLRELFANILRSTPLHLNSAQHSFFWHHLTKFHTDFFGADPEDVNEFIIIVNDNEQRLEISYNRALFLILRVIVEPQFQKGLLSCYSIPHAITAAFCRRVGMRTYFLHKALHNAQDSLCLSRLFLQSEMKLESQQQLQRFYYEELGNKAQSTPEQEIREHGHCIEDAMVNFFPREQNNNILPADPRQLALVLATYRFLWSEVAGVVSDVRRLLTTHEKGCRCYCSAVSMENCMALLQVVITRKLDLKTLSRHAFYMVLHAPFFQPVLGAIARSADMVRAFLMGSSSPVITRLFELTASSETARRNVLSRFAQFPKVAKIYEAEQTEAKLKWEPIRLGHFPVKLLLEAMDLHYAVTLWTTKLRAFLYGKRRSLYIAYSLPDKTVYADVVLTIQYLAKEYGQVWPNLDLNFCAVKLLDKVFIVALPQQMLALRLLSLLSMHMNSDDEPTALTSTVYLRCATARFAEHGELLAQISQYALAKVLAWNLGGQELANLVALPGTDRFELYALLPKAINFFDFPNSESGRSIFYWMLAGRGSITIPATPLADLFKYWQENGYMPWRFSEWTNKPKVVLRTARCVKFLTVMLTNAGLIPNCYESAVIAAMQMYKDPWKPMKRECLFATQVKRHMSSLEEEVAYIKPLCERLTNLNCLKQEIPRIGQFEKEVVDLFFLNDYTLNYNFHPTLRNEEYQQTLRMLHRCEWNYIYHRWNDDEFQPVSYDSLELVAQRTYIPVDSEGRLFFEQSLHLLSSYPDTVDNAVPNSEGDIVMLNSVTVQSLACQFNTPWSAEPDVSSAEYISALAKMQPLVQDRA